jgi:SAM-dependent methyltransferase
MLRAIWKLLDRPSIWQFVQATAGKYTAQAYQRALTELLRLHGSEAVLDIGCGTGEYSRLLNYREYVGVDFNDQYIRMASQKFGEDGRVQFLSIDVADVPNLNLKLDAAFCVAVTHHLSNNELRKLIPDVLRAVSMRFVIVDMVLPPIWRNPVSHLLIRMDRGRYGRSKQSLIEILKTDGHQIEALSDTFGFPHRVIGISLRKPAASDG